MKVTVNIPTEVYNSTVLPLLKELPQTKRAAIYRAALVSGAAMAAAMDKEKLREWLYNYSEDENRIEILPGLKIHNGLKPLTTDHPARDKKPARNKTLVRKGGTRE
jgi:hypothetical protein